MAALPYETLVEDVIVRIESRLSQNQNVREKISAVLKNGPRAFRVATLYEIINPETNEHHHWCLKITSIDRSKTKGWNIKPEKTVPLDDDGSQELQVLADILKRARGGEFADREGEFHLPASEMQGIKALLRASFGSPIEFSRCSRTSWLANKREVVGRRRNRNQYESVFGEPTPAQITPRAVSKLCQIPPSNPGEERQLRARANAHRCCGTC